MTSRAVAYLSLACALAACAAGPAGPPTAPSDPVGGAEPAGQTGYEAPGGTADMGPPGPGSTIAQLCAYDCMRFQAACPGGGGTDCAASCVQSVMSFPGCQAQFRSYLACVTSAPVQCVNGSLKISGCEADSTAISNCAGQLRVLGQR